jgi:hypothetical protein
MNDLKFTRLLFRLKKADTDEKKAELYGDLSEEAKALSNYHKWQDPDYAAPLKIEDQDTF